MPGPPILGICALCLPPSLVLGQAQPTCSFPSALAPEISLPSSPAHTQLHRLPLSLSRNLSVPFLAPGVSPFVPSETCILSGPPAPHGLGLAHNTQVDPPMCAQQCGHRGRGRAPRSSCEDPLWVSWVWTVGAPLPHCILVGGHLLSLGTKWMRRLLTFTWAGWI